jgi:hypothetical protein
MMDLTDDQWAIMAESFEELADTVIEAFAVATAQNHASPRQFAHNTYIQWCKHHNIPLRDINGDGEMQWRTADRVLR